MNLHGLSKQVGPLPLGVWLLVGGGGLFIAYRRAKAPAPDAVPAGPPVDGLPVGGGSGSPASWDGAPVVLSPVIQNAPPSVPVTDSAPIMDAGPILAPEPIPVPPATPRVPIPVRSAPRPPAPRPVAHKPAAPKPAAHKGLAWDLHYYRIGSHGSRVSDIQRKVGATVDGKYGPKTAAAVKSFQKQNGLTADGVVGPKTWAKLYR